jgi:hypothetical protein
MLAASPLSGAAMEDGLYVMQCSCPVEWTGDWDGNGIFIEDDSLDTIVLVNGDVTVLMHELPIDASTVEDMTLDRTSALEDYTAIDDLELVWEDDSADTAEAGRTWTNPSGDTVASFQFVQVWETNYLLSIEVIAPVDDFEDDWDSLEDVLLVGLPILDDIDPADLAEEFGI